MAKTKKLKEIEVVKSQTEETDSEEPKYITTQAAITEINGVDHIAIKCPDCGIWLHLPLVTIRLLKHKRKHKIRERGIA